MGNARDLFQLEVAETLTNWRLGCIPPRYDPRRDAAVYHAGVAEIVKLRLLIVYVPLFRTLQRIENQLAILVTTRGD